MMDAATRTARTRARQIEQEADRLSELWRIRGKVAGQNAEPRQAPRIPSNDPAIRAERAAAWLAGYDGAAPKPLTAEWSNAAAATGRAEQLLRGLERALRPPAE